MEFIPGPGLCPDPRPALPEKCFQALYRCLAAEVPGYEFLKAFSNYRIDGGLPSESQPAGLLKEFLIDFKRNVGHFGASTVKCTGNIAQ
jgi:hypothetical protein